MTEQTEAARSLSSAILLDEFREVAHDAGDAWKALQGRPGRRNGNENRARCASPRSALLPRPVLSSLCKRGGDMRFQANSKRPRKDGEEKLWNDTVGYKSYKYRNFGVRTYRTGRSPPLGIDFA